MILTSHRESHHTHAKNVESTQFDRKKEKECEQKPDDLYAYGC